MAEDADARIGAGGEQPVGGVPLVHHVDRAVAPGAEYAVAGFHLRHGRSGLDDFACLLIAEVANREGPARRLGIAEDAVGEVPLPVHEG